MASFNINEWEIIETIKKDVVFKVKNIYGYQINGNNFDFCIIKKVPTNKDNKSLRETNILQNVLTDSEKIVKYYGCQYDEKFTYIFIEFIEGYTLEQYLIENGPLDDKTISLLSREILHLINYIHSKQVIHRDLSASNIMYDIKTRKWKLIDFGLSFYFKDNERGSKNNTKVGTYGYQAPETLLGAGGASRKSDVWSFGKLIIKMLGGTPTNPDDASNKDEIPPIPERAHRFCKNFIKKCFIYDPIIRFDSMGLNCHPFITYFALNKDSLHILQKEHKIWVETTQKKKNISVNEDEIIYINDNTELNESTIPNGIVHVIFSNEFNKPVPNKLFSKSVKIVDFGIDGKSLFNHELTKSNFPNTIVSLTLGNGYMGEIPYWCRHLTYLSVGKERKEIFRFPCNLETLKYYGSFEKSKLGEKSLPSIRLFNLIMPNCNGPILKNTIPPTVNFLAWGIFYSMEEIESLKLLPSSIDDLTFSCDNELFKKIQKKHIPNNISILIIDTLENGRPKRNLIDLRDNMGNDEFLYFNTITN